MWCHTLAFTGTLAGVWGAPRCDLAASAHSTSCLTPPSCQPPDLTSYGEVESVRYLLFPRTPCPDPWQTGDPQGCCNLYAGMCWAPGSGWTRGSLLPSCPWNTFAHHAPPPDALGCLRTLAHGPLPDREQQQSRGGSRGGGWLGPE